jgi:hypothetical protein
VNSSKTKVTKDRMAKIYRVLGYYLANNRRLPCPASVLLTKSNASYGTEVRPNSGGQSICSNGSTTSTGVYQAASDAPLVYGMVPVRTLGLSSDMAEDGFGSKIGYMIIQDFAGDYVPVSSTGQIDFAARSFSTTAHSAIVTSTAMMTVNEIRGGNSATMNSSAIVALISYGGNKAGAINASGTTQNTRGDSDEQENDINLSSPTAATVSFNRTIVAVSDGRDAFDDIVLFKTAQNFIDDFKLMSLMPCKDASGTGFGSAPDAYNGQTIYGTSCSTSAATLVRGAYQKKCDDYGNWVDLVSSCS